MDPDTDWVSSPWGPGLDFDGAGDYVSIANPGPILDGKFISCVAWVKPLDAGTDYPRFIDRVYNGQFVFYWSDKNYPAAQNFGVSLKNSVGGLFDSATLFGNDGITAGVWQQVAFTWDGADVRVYSNGTESGSTAFAGAGLATSASDIRIGQRADGTNRDYEGQMACIGVWSRVLSAKEIRDLYADSFAFLRPRHPVSLCTGLFQRTYNLYRGTGGISGVDFSTPVGTVEGAESSKTWRDMGHDADARYTYVLRPVRQDADGNDLETPDLSCRVEFETDGDGDWLGDRPGPVEALTAEIISGGEIRLRWRYRTPYGGTAPNDFGIYYGTTPSITPGSPNATESYTADGEYSKDLTLIDGVAYYFAITARDATPVESHLSGVIGPYIADDTAPDTPSLLTSTTF